MDLKRTPSRDADLPGPLGFTVPGRFERHERTLMTWPPREEAAGTVVPGYLPGFRDEVEAAALAIARFEPVTMVVDPRDTVDALQRFVSEDAIEIVEIPVDCCWLRDNGPIFVRSSAGDEVAGVHFGFNGWGGRFPCEATAEMPVRLLEHLGLRTFRTDFICEGGGVSFDGEGSVIMTEQVMLNSNRYAAATHSTIERQLADWLGIEQVIWFELGLAEDTETDGHVDNVVEFVAPGVALVQTVSDRSNPNYDRLRDNLERLRAARDARGRRVEIIEMDVLPYAAGPDGRPLAIPYTNAYVVNDAVIAPEVDPALDDAGYRILEKAFPGRTIVPVPSHWQAVGGGGLGCITQQVPACR